MIFYLTFNDLPSGIYSSQVIDVVNFLRQELKSNLQLVSFISIRGFFGNRKKIKKGIPNALVIPMFPGVHRWRKNSIALRVIYFFYRPKLIIGRSVLATQLALKLKYTYKGLKVVYDGRGAIAAEWSEYNVIINKQMLAEIEVLEGRAIQHSDFRISVSEQLVKYWQKTYGYQTNDHVVIPCTINRVFENKVFSEEEITKTRSELGFNTNESVFVYSGSLAGWQSFDVLSDVIRNFFNIRPESKLLVLADKDQHITKLENEFSGRVVCKKVNPDKVPDYLVCCNYGLLIRENTITNRVASPVKFAEYLACGLPVIISAHIGDYSQFVVQHQCGFLCDDFKNLQELKLSSNDIRGLALTHFTKKKHLHQYEKVLAHSQY